MESTYSTWHQVQHGQTKIDTSSVTIDGVHSANSMGEIVAGLVTKKSISSLVKFILNMICINFCVALKPSGVPAYFSVISCSKSSIFSPLYHVIYFGLSVLHLVPCGIC